MTTPGTRAALAVTAGAAAIALTAGCTSSVRGVAAPAAPSTSSGSPAAPTSEAAEPALNDRGNIVKAVGEEGGLDGDDGAPLLTFTVEAVTVDVPCTEDWQAYGSEPDPGHHLVGIDVRLTTTPELAGTDYLSLSAYDFDFIGPDGVTVDDLAGIATYGCLDDGETFTHDTFGPAQTYTGTVVLDVPARSGTLVLDPSWGQSGGWEYAF